MSPEAKGSYIVTLSNGHCHNAYWDGEKFVELEGDSRGLDVVKWQTIGEYNMCEQPDSIGTGGSLGAQRIPNYSPDTAHYAPGDIVMGTDGNLWRLTWLDGHGYWQRMPVLNVETMKLEHKA